MAIPVEGLRDDWKMPDLIDLMVPQAGIKIDDMDFVLTLDGLDDVTIGSHVFVVRRGIVHCMHACHADDGGARAGGDELKIVQCERRGHGRCER